MTSERTGGTRERVVVLLRRHGRLSAPQLAELLELSSVGLRRHLALLERDGLVSSVVEKPKRGRPTAVYRLTDAGLETFPRHYDEVAREALAFLKGQDAATLAQFLAWRTDALAEVLNEQGFMAEVEPADGGLRLCQHNCTVEHLATELPDLCASEAELFERLLGTRVERESTIVDGAVRCETRIDLGTRGKRALSRTTTPSPNRKAARSSA